MGDLYIYSHTKGVFFEGLTAIKKRGCRKNSSQIRIKKLPWWGSIGRIILQTYVIRFNHPDHGTVSCEIIAGTMADAREDFERRYPNCDLLSMHVKPYKHWAAKKNDKRSIN
ncbi:hypothetical protein [Paenibacillus sp. USDA918EY]|uniref:hypothetical protein n=1 Tax=Paenibacillus sp. USDA918EY TaxID=2689575 RepID=UPI001F29775A|nr:hypothetical protein [Paenibacillus sp. USDA918EY]